MRDPAAPPHQGIYRVPPPPPRATAQIKRLLQKSKEVVIKVQKHIRKVVSQSSKLHIYLWLMQKSSVYLRLNNEFCGICSHQLKVAEHSFQVPMPNSP